MIRYALNTISTAANVDGDAANQDLSTRRAEAVRQALTTRHHVDASKLTASGFGASRLVHVLSLCGVVALASACGGGGNQAAPNVGAKPAAATSAAATAATAAGPIDVCAIVTADEAKALLGSLPMQPPAKTDNAGFGIRDCMYIGPALSGAGAQTHFARLMVQAGSTKDAEDMLQADADRRKATVSLSGVGDAAKRNAEGMFVWATKGGIYCTAEISVGLPPKLTADSAAAGLADLCRKIFAAAAR